MKTAIFIREGRKQIMLTPENDFERDILQEVENEDIETTFQIGSFYECQGGWDRINIGKDSLMIVLDTKKEA